MNGRIFALGIVITAAFTSLGAAAVIGANVPATPLSEQRIATLPAPERGAWSAYLARSQAQMQADQAALTAERQGLQTLPPPPAASEGHTNMPLNRDAAWYGSADARAVADNIVSFQTPAGGWGKNQNRAGPARVRGESYVIQEHAIDPNSGNLDTPRDPNWHYVGTFDNDATTDEMRFLARVAGQTTGPARDTYRASFVKGVRYLLAAQYPNGGWPQVWPLEGGYHDAITYNDNAVADVATLLDDISNGQGDYAFVPQDLRAQAGAAARRAVDVILASQVTLDGHKTIWAQQIDMLTLAPTSARNYEMPSLSSSESSDTLVFLMQQPHPTPAIKAAVRDGVAWLTAHAIHDHVFQMTPQGRELVAQAGAPALWSRYYSLTTQQPIFGDRDKSIHDDIADISQERRNGYSWYNTTPQHALDLYARWSAANP